MTLLPVDEALRRILEGAKPQETEQLALASAGGRIVAEPVTARLMQPPFDCSAMDGYALIAPEQITYPLELEIIGESSAGQRFAGELSSGQAVRIFTGAPLPEKADTVVIQEHTQRAGNKLAILEGIDKTRHIRRAGLDFAPDDSLLPVGRELDGPSLSLAAASGNNTISVFAKPRIAILATGDELVSPGTAPGPDQIVASNSVGIAEIVRRSGGIAEDLGIIRDDPALIEAAISAALDGNSDILVTIGGASVGERDFIHGALRNCGVDLDFWKIAMRPGKPLMYGRKTVLGKAVHVIGLPGNPVSSLVCSLVFLRPLIARLSGTDLTADIRAAQLGAAFPPNKERRDYIRATLKRSDDGALVATPFPTQDSSMLSALAKADALLIREPGAPAASIGDPCHVLML
ncbi:molybdopterin molybdenumtransferase MoeA [Falsochrobactrum shanghaiense]|uniref:Molybdopterin molybdenumtransferase n=1 Tax=Falsochrobactrum shanghaiense TaxID=2201899 RepID=A0A316J934_9HYPH|nr:gephyrin-like molybdotransferase Glp [Falsochrobactrum shanghaiense]PWL17826.1 molybdopterin molybdenumtransferase MoeA [Falsochrobactrum shanghaiense]